MAPSLFWWWSTPARWEATAVLIPHSVKSPPAAPCAHPPVSLEATPGSLTRGPVEGPALERVSALYEGTVCWQRPGPPNCSLSYPVALLYLDLDELPELVRGRWLWSLDRPNWGSLQRTDFLEPHHVPLDEAVRQWVANATGQRPEGPIRLLTQARYLGHLPRTPQVYYVFALDGITLEAVVVDLVREPGQPRQRYVLSVAQSRRQGAAMLWDHTKPLSCAGGDEGLTYAWRFTPPGPAVRLHLQRQAAPGLVTEALWEASLVLKHRRPLTGRSWARVLWQNPWLLARKAWAWGRYQRQCAHGA